MAPVSNRPFGHHMHPFFSRKSPNTHSTYPVARKLRATPGFLRDLQNREFNRGIQRYIYPQLGTDSCLAVLKYTVTEPMPCYIGGRASPGERSRRPRNVRFPRRANKKPRRLHRKPDRHARGVKRNSCAFSPQVYACPLSEITVPNSDLPSRSTTEQALSALARSSHCIRDHPAESPDTIIEHKVRAIRFNSLCQPERREQASASPAGQAIPPVCGESAAPPVFPCHPG